MKQKNPPETIDMNSENISNLKKIRNILFPFRWLYFIVISLWIFGSFFSPFSKNDGVLSAMVIYSVLFIFPILIIETGFYLKKRSTCGKSKAPHTPLPEKGSKYISPSRMASILLLVFTIYLLLVGFITTISTEEDLSGNISPGIVFAVITVVVFVISLFSSKTKEEAIQRKEQRRKNYKKPLPGQAVGGIILCIIGGYFSIGLLCPLMAITDKEFYTAMGKAGVIVMLIIGVCGAFLFKRGIGYLHGKYVDKALARKRYQKSESQTYHSSDTQTNHTENYEYQSRSAQEVNECKNDPPQNDSQTIYANSDIAEENPRLQKRREYYYQRYGVDVCNIYNVNGEILSHLSSIEFLEGHTFEYFCADLLKDSGFSDVEVTPGSGDQGADIIAQKDEIRYAIQCKHKDDPYSTKFGNKPIQEVYTGMSFYKCDRGVVLTNGYFSEGGKNAAFATGVELWDRDELLQLLVNAGFEYHSDYIGTTTQEEPTEKVEENEDSTYRTFEPGTVETIETVYENIIVQIDVESFSYFGLKCTDISIDKECDPPDEIDLLFDIRSIEHKRYSVDIDVVCNIYGAGRKLATETHWVNMDKFRGRDSATIMFDKKNICNAADRIEIYCKEC